jgi:hypothetical protein
MSTSNTPIGAPPQPLPTPGSPGGDGPVNCNAPEDFAAEDAEESDE